MSRKIGQFWRSLLGLSTHPADRYKEEEERARQKDKEQASKQREKQEPELTRVANVGYLVFCANATINATPTARATPEFKKLEEACSNLGKQIHSKPSADPSLVRLAAQARASLMLQAIYVNRTWTTETICQMEEAGANTEARIVCLGGKDPTQLLNDLDACDYKAMSGPWDWNHEKAICESITSGKKCESNSHKSRWCSVFKDWSSTNLSGISPTDQKANAKPAIYQKTTSPLATEKVARPSTVPVVNCGKAQEPTAKSQIASGQLGCGEDWAYWVWDQDWPTNCLRHSGGMSCREYNPETIPSDLKEDLEKSHLTKYPPSSAQKVSAHRTSQEIVQATKADKAIRAHVHRWSTEGLGRFDECKLDCTRLAGRADGWDRESIPLCKQRCEAAVSRFTGGIEQRADHVGRLQQPVDDNEAMKRHVQWSFGQQGKGLDACSAGCRSQAEEPHHWKRDKIPQCDSLCESAVRRYPIVSYTHNR
ncbi:hypothetical protein XA68_10860 [Ophiocordyceps unilateralis]|uniref:Uncharacterized protein n=1 Tax=Ophiocordyceps unilateralis TaxID=268505 RepID=A0A2A9P0U1_OPHUN|nr:hypothetical protein XA68_10860 [Ophiocordyceps unilateralis]